MPRETEPGWPEILFNFFMKAPWWIGPLTVVFIFLIILLGLPLVDPLIAQFSKKLVDKAFSPIVTNVTDSKESTPFRFFSNISHTVAGAAAVFVGFIWCVSLIVKGFQRRLLSKKNKEYDSLANR